MSAVSQLVLTRWLEESGGAQCYRQERGGLTALGGGEGWGSLH